MTIAEYLSINTFSKGCEKYGNTKGLKALIDIQVLDAVTFNLLNREVGNMGKNHPIDNKKGFKGLLDLRQCVTRRGEILK